MPTSQGTRQRQGVQKEHPEGTAMTRTLTRDVGLSKNVTASMTFAASPTSQIQAANGTFAAFVVGDPILIQGTSLNNGYAEVAAIDAVNHAYLTIDYPPKAEGPITTTVRTR